MAMPLIPAFVLLPAFYAETVGLGLAQTGFILLLVRLTDVISDPLVGWASDHIRRWRGGRKAQIGVGALIAGYSLYQLFTPSPGAGEYYLFIWYGLMLLGWTIIQIPYLAWVVDLTGDYQKRVGYNAAREFSGLIGIMLLSIVLVVTAGSEEMAQLRTSAIFVLVCGALAFPFLLFLPSRKISVAPFRFFKSLSGLQNNRLFFRLIIAWFISGLSIGIATACFPLFVKHNLQLDGSYNSYLLFVYFMAGVGGIPLWLWISKRYGKHQTWGIAMILASVAFFSVPFFGPGQYILFGILCVITGFALGADLAMPPAIQSDVVDWDSYLNNVDRSSILFALWSMATKLSLGLGVAFAFTILGQPGMGISGETVEAEINITQLAVIYGWVPAVLKLTAVGLMWNFPLGAAQHSAVRRRLDRHLNSPSSV